MKQDSYTKVNIETVRTACKKALEEYERLAFEKNEEKVKAEMSRRFFRAKTREEAIANLKKDTWNFWPRSYYNAEISRINAISKLVSVSCESDILLSASDAAILF